MGHTGTQIIRAVAIQGDSTIWIFNVSTRVDFSSFVCIAIIVASIIITVPYPAYDHNTFGNSHVRWLRGFDN